MYWLLILIFMLCMIAITAIVLLIKDTRKINHERILLKRQIDKMILDSKYLTESV